MKQKNKQVIVRISDKARKHLKKKAIDAGTSMTAYLDSILGLKQGYPQFAFVSTCVQFSIGVIYLYTSNNKKVMDKFTKTICLLIVIGFVVGIYYAKVNGFIIQ